MNENNNAAPAPAPRRKWWIPAGILVALAAAFFAIRGNRATAKSHNPAQETPAVAAVKVTRQSVARTQVFDAELRPYEEVEIHAKVAGFLEKIGVDVGDQVKAGDALATLEVPEIQDELEHAQAVQRRSEEEYNRSVAAYDETHLSSTRLSSVAKAKPGLVAQQDLDMARTKDRAAEASVAGAKQQVAVSTADIKKLRTMLGYAKIVAPFDGVVTMRYADPGALVRGGSSSSSPIIRLSQNNRLRVVFPVSVSSVPFVKAGDSIEVRIQSINRTIAAKISRFTRKIESATRTMEVEADIDNADLSLVPGMYASVSLIIERHEAALTLPVEAVSRQKTTTAWIINAQHEIEEKVVKIGIETPAALEITEGVREGDMVMIGSRTQIRPGEKVTAKLSEATNQ